MRREAEGVPAPHSYCVTLKLSTPLSCVFSAVMISIVVYYNTYQTSLNQWRNSCLARLEFHPNSLQGKLHSDGRPAPSQRYWSLPEKYCGKLGKLSCRTPSLVCLSICQATPADVVQDKYALLNSVQDDPSHKTGCHREHISPLAISALGLVFPL